MTIKAKKLILVSALLVTYVANAQWTKIPGYNEHISGLLYSQGKLVVADEQSGSTYQLLQSVGSWEKINDNSGFSFAYDITHTDSLFWISTQTGFMYSNQLNSNWILSGGDPLLCKNYHLATSMAVLPPEQKGLPYRLFSGTLGGGFFKSLDGGHNWTEIDSVNIHSFDILDLKTHIYVNGKIDYFMINLKGVFESVDEGETWIKSDSAATVVHPRKLYYLNNQWFLTTYDGLYRRDLNKRAWNKCTNKFPLGNLIDNMVSENSIIYAGHPFYGILKSSDNGENWTIIDSFKPGINIDIIDIVAMAINKDTLIVGTGGNGIWQSNIHNLINSTTTIYTNPSFIEFYSKSANPFITETQLSVQLSKSDFITIGIYNIKGQQIKKLVNNRLNEGNYTFNWNGQTDNGIPVPAGVYFAVLKSTDSIKQIKLLKAGN